MGWRARRCTSGSGSTRREAWAGLADRRSRPLSCPHQMDPVVEARVVEMRHAHPGWGPRTMLFWLERDGVAPLPGRTSVERCRVSSLGFDRYFRDGRDPRRGRFEARQEELL